MADAERVFGAYERKMERKKVSATAKREFRLTTTAFMAWLKREGLEMEEIRAAHIEEFMAQTPWGVSTQHSRLCWLRAPWLYAINELEMLTRNPFRYVDLPDMPVKDPVTIPAKILRAMKAAAKDNEESALFHTFAFTGLRLMEVRGLRWEDVSFAEQTLFIRGKGCRERTIPLHPDLGAALAAYGVYGKGAPYVFPGAGGLEMTHNGMSKKAERMMCAGPYTPHAFRRTVASSLQANGAEYAAVKQILGHSKAGDITLKHYTHLSQAVLYRELLKLYRDDPV